MFIILLLYVWMKHPGHTYGGFVSAISERGMTFHYPDKSPIIEMIQTCKVWNWYFHTSKKFQNWHGGRIVQMEQLSFWEGVQLPNKMWIINWGSKSNLNLVWLLKGFKPFGEKSINSIKFCLDMIFNTMNLDWLTCIPKFKVSLQVLNGLKRKIKRDQIWIWNPFDLMFYYANTIETLKGHCNNFVEVL
jgi:hypothetical protein